ncbi:DUF4394 domain-containing protein [Vannielia litorea]|uniref:DUF4394 domain-containing protein n=1 Tax=Vannielia litorea TaxID=1217970 RepID=A0A1N6E568_9RHOB|nr:DUF4394 domain-containing protein [Vannielia litorea]SIN78205.1 protein of unknown function [Vannielia litorea]
MTRSTLRTTLAASALGLAAAPLLADGHAGQMGYALANDGATLVVMADIATPGEVQTFDLAQPLRAIAYRPVTGDLLGFADGMIVTVNPASGEVTDLGAAFDDNAMIGADAYVAFDFNNAIDAVRAVGSDGANLVYFPEGFGDNDPKANSVKRFTDAAYAEGDANAGATPMIFANAYTNAISGAKASGTAQFALDAATDSLVTLANNDGTLATVGKVTVDGEAVDLSAWGGFDIVSPEEGTDMAYAVLQMEGAESAGLYAIDLSSGAATMLADLGMGGFSGFAVSPGM